MIWQVVFTEIVGTIHCILWFIGLMCVTVCPVILAYACWTAQEIDVGENRGEGSAYVPDPDSRSTTLHPRMYAFSTGQILDECREHRRCLKNLHKLLCDRAGVEPDSCCPMADLITEAVFDGHSQYKCINSIDRAFQERGQQHA